MITQWKTLRPLWRWTIGISIALAIWILFFWGIIAVVGFSSRRVAIWAFVVVWFFHLAVGFGAGFAAWRMWPDRENPFIQRLIVTLHALMFSALWAIVLLFLSRGVRLTWKFSIALFGGVLIMDAIMLPLILYIIRGPGREKTEIASRSGELPPDFWKQEFRQAVRDEVKDEYLKSKDD
jgi:hypothetical protein